MPAPNSHNPFLEILDATSKIDPGALVTLWANLPPHPPGFTGDLFERFDDIDSDSDGFIDRDEVDWACSDPVFKGSQAASLATLRKMLHELEELSNDEVGLENDGVTRADLAGLDLMAYSDPEHDFVKNVNKIHAYAQHKIEAAPRTVFVDESVPSIAPMRCRQGIMGDCFVLAPLICLAHRNPERLLAMIGRHPERPGQWQIRFPRSEKPITLDEPTDAQIALFSSADGLWSVMFELAYGVQVYRDAYGALTKLEVNAHGGPIEDVIGVLTGNPVEVLEIDDVTIAEIGEHLEDAMARGALVAAGTKAKREADSDGPQYTADGLTRSHAYSILDYHDGVALVRNPWGGTKGGLKGQPMKDGVFEMPLPFLFSNFRKICIEQ
jgi:hypothetical protein